MTGSAGRVGRAIYIKLMKQHQVVGLDLTPCSTVDIIGDIRDKALIEQTLKGVDVVVHVAALHAPHVSLRTDEEFNEINVQATEFLMQQGAKLGIQHFVFTSTTALFGYASTPTGVAGWVDEATQPKPKSIYHRTKLAAEQRLEQLSIAHNIPVTVLRMSRCFPEPVNLMSVYRLTRGIDARDVANAHACAIERRLAGFTKFIISGKSPFQFEDCQGLFDDAQSMLKMKSPELAKRFTDRGWQLPLSLDRVYDSSAAQRELGWQPLYGFEDVIEQYDAEFAEVLPAVELY